MNQIDINKKYRTRNGQEVKIFSVDGGGEQPVHGAIYDQDEWEAQEWTKEGYYLLIAGSDYDLIEYDEKSELLEEAKRRYPKGTRFKDINGKLTEANCEPWFIGWVSDHRIAVRDEGDGGVCYLNGQWAEIVEESKQPSKLEQLEQLAKELLERINELK